MKGIILAGGKGTRLQPLTGKCNKHLLPVGSEPMLFNPIKQLISAGIVDILIISSSQHIGSIIHTVSSSHVFGCNFSFAVQKEARGIAHALLAAEGYTGGDIAAVILGDNVATHSIKPYAEKFKLQRTGAKVLLSKVMDPESFGVAVIKEGRIEKIVEKPDRNISSYAVTGIYFYDNRVFDIIKEVKPSARGELEITSVNNIYLSGQELTYDVIKGSWTDAGTSAGYKYANALLAAVNNEIIY
ncbi:MAG TPA: sugar phosphate nucleotidyltransferase [Clostridia bacterium]|nr:sugar phosphate nucleotidyltransferase [Clostridia bacterium]